MVDFWVGSIDNAWLLLPCQSGALTIYCLCIPVYEWMEA
jgi:hypothetical protein